MKNVANYLSIKTLFYFQLKPKKVPLHTGISQTSGEKLYFKLLKNPSGKLEYQNVKSDISTLADDWLTVGFYNQNHCIVNGFFSPSDVMVTNTMNSDRVPYVDEITKLELQSDTTYEFHICAINSFGMGPWSTIYEFKTLKNVEGIMNNNNNNANVVDISLITGGILIKWKLSKFKKTADAITYSVQLLKVNPSSGKTFYDEVFSGPETECSISSTWLKEAHFEIIDNKSSIVFRIERCNKHGLVLNTVEFKWSPK